MFFQVRTLTSVFAKTEKLALTLSKSAALNNYKSVKECLISVLSSSKVVQNMSASWKDHRLQLVNFT